MVDIQASRVQPHNNTWTRFKKYFTKPSLIWSKEDSWLIPGSSDSHLTMQIRARGRRVRVWRLKAELFRGDNGDSGDAELIHS